MILRLKISLFIPLIILIILPLVTTLSGYSIHVIILIFYYGSLALAWNIIGGYAGQLSLGHAVYVGIGAYIPLMLIVFYSIPIWYGIVLSCIASILFSILIGYPCFKLKGAYFSLSTLAIMEAVKALVMYFDKYTGGTFGLWMPVLGSRPHVGFYQIDRIHQGSPFMYLQFEGKLPYYYIFLIMFVAYIYVSYYIQNSDFGLLLRAIKDDEDAADVLGVSVRWTKIKALIISSILTSIMGVLYLTYITYVEPFSIFSLDLSLTPVLISTIGGLATTVGPIIGTIVYIPVSEYIRGLLGGTYVGVHLILFGLFGILVILLMPEGIYGKIKSTWTSIKFGKR